MIIFWIAILMLCCVGGVLNLQVIRRQVQDPIPGLPWWVPMLGFTASLAPVYFTLKYILGRS